MSVWPGLRVILAIAAIAIAGSACSRGAASTPGGSAATPTAAPTAAVSRPTASVVPPSASVAARPSPIATTTPRASSRPLISAEPPAATLAAEGGDPVPGQLGSYTWADGGSDSPWLPGAPLAVGAGEPLTVSLGDRVMSSEWSARRVRSGSTTGAGAVVLGSGGSPMTFTAPDRGSWSVQVVVQFADGLGSGTWYWNLTVR